MLTPGELSSLALAEGWPLGRGVALGLWGAPLGCGGDPQAPEQIGFGFSRQWSPAARPALSSALIAWDWGPPPPWQQPPLPELIIRGNRGESEVLSCILCMKSRYSL